MVVLHTNYVEPGSIPAPINHVEANPNEVAQAPQAAAQMYNEIGQSTDQMDRSIAYMNTETQRANLREQYKQERLQNQLYLANNSIGAQTDTYFMQQQLQSNTKPGGNMVLDTLNNYKDIANAYTQNAPNPRAAEEMQMRLEQNIPHLVQWAQNAQNTVDTQSSIQNIHTRAQQASMLANNDPTQADAFAGQIDDLGKSYREAGIWSPHIQGQIDAAKKTIYNNASISQAQSDPISMLKTLNTNPESIQMGDPQLLTRLGKIAQSSVNGQITQASKNLDDVRSSILNGFQVPTDTGDRLAHADAITKMLSINGLDSNTAQLLNIKQAHIAGLIGAQQEFVGKTVQDLSAIKTALQTDIARSPGDSGAIGLKKDILQLTDNKIKALNDNPYQVEQADGTMPVPQTQLSQALSNKNAMQQFIQERQNVANSGQAKYGHGFIPFTDSDISTIQQNLQGQSPTQKLKSLSFLDNFDSNTQTATIDKLFRDSKEAGAFNAAVRLLPYDSNMATNIAQGMEMMTGKDGKMAAPVSGNKATQAIGDTFQGLFSNDPNLLHQYSDAANALVTQQHMTSGGSINPEEAFSKALKDVSGAESVSRGFFNKDYSTILPYIKQKDGTYSRITSSDFNDSISKLTDKDLNTYGNGNPVFPLDGSPVQAKNVQTLKWLPVSDGKYRLVDDTKGIEKSMVNDNGKGYIFDMKNYLHDTKGY